MAATEPTSAAAPDRDLPVGTVTFVFTDIEGSTRLADTLGPAGYGDVLERHRRILREVWDRHGGVEVGTEGDSFFVVFGLPTDAVAACADAQRALAAAAWPDGISVRVRMGVHTGLGVVVGGTYVGHDVNRAARIAAAASGGQVLLSDTTRALVASALPADTRLRDLGEHRLKDLRPEPIAQLGVDGLPDDFPPIRSLDARPNNLPVQLTSFVGRERELEESRALLERTRLLTLTGPGGTGKTRLGLQLAASLADTFDGVCFVALEPVSDPALVPPAIATALGVGDGGRESAMDRIVDRIGSRRVLLLLDNFEQVVEAAPSVAELLRRAPAATVVVTSRAVLRVSGEQEYPVPGLPVPPDLRGLSPEDRLNLPAELRNGVDATMLSQYESVRLFIARALAVRPSFSVTNDNAPAVAEICTRLSGMPLALELAAARLKLFTPEQILARLGRQLDLLAGDMRDLPDRQRTLRGAIAWSFDLLDEGHRRLLERASVFAGGFDPEMAEKICGPGEELGLDILDGLAALVDHSLVGTDMRSDEPRFVLLETIRAFARERLEARGEAATIRRRHAQAFQALVSAAAPNLSGSDQRLWLDRIERDHDNVRAALDWAISYPEPDIAMQISWCIWRFWQKRGHLNEARIWLERVLAEPWSRQDKVRRAKVLEAAGGVAYWQGDATRAGPAYAEALAIWREIGDKTEIANALYNYGFCDVIQSAAGRDVLGRSLEDVLATLEEARAIYEELGDEHGVATLTWALGGVHYFRAMSLEASEKFVESLEMFRRLGDRTMEAWALHMLGTSQIHLGRYEEARETLRHALRDFHEVGDVAGMTLLFDDFSALAVTDGDLPRAARLRGVFIGLAAETGTELAVWIQDQFEQLHRPTVRTALGEEELERYGREGRAMTLEEAYAYALEGATGDAHEA
jgi:predicted ATPase/class 3 adenylate cyclase